MMVLFSFRIIRQNEILALVLKKTNSVIVIGIRMGRCFTLECLNSLVAICAVHPCTNGGSCIDNGRDLCICMPGFTGVNCENGIINSLNLS